MSKVLPAKRLCEFFGRGYNERPRDEWPLPESSFLAEHELPADPKFYEIREYETPTGADQWLFYGAVSLGKIPDLGGRAGRREAA